MKIGKCLCYKFLSELFIQTFFMLHFVIRSSNGRVEAVQTSENTLYSKKAVIVAAGCWTGSLMQDLFRNWGMEFHVPVRPRKVCIYTA